MQLLLLSSPYAASSSLDMFVRVAVILSCYRMPLLEQRRTTTICVCICVYVCVRQHACIVSEALCTLMLLLPVIFFFFFFLFLLFVIHFDFVFNLFMSRFQSFVICFEIYLLLLRSSCKIFQHSYQLAANNVGSRKFRFFRCTVVIAISQINIFI